MADMAPIRLDGEFRTQAVADANFRFKQYARAQIKPLPARVHPGDRAVVDRDANGWADVEGLFANRPAKTSCNKARIARAVDRDERIGLWRADLSQGFDPSPSIT